LELGIGRSHSDSDPGSEFETSDVDYSYEEDIQPRVKRRALVPKNQTGPVPTSGNAVKLPPHPNMCEAGCALSETSVNILREDLSQLKLEELLERYEKALKKFIELFGVQISQNIANNAGKYANVNEFMLARNQTVWMTGQLMATVPKEAIYPMLKPNPAAGLPGLPEDKRALLVLDNCKVHHDPAFVRQCLDYRIDLMYLYPNSTQHLQPGDISYNGPLKNNYYSLCYSQNLVKESSDSGQKGDFYLYLQHLARIRGAACMVKCNTVTNGFLHALFKAHIPPEERRKYKCEVYDQIKEGRYHEVNRNISS
jgi:hypothetical protein